MGGDVQVGQTLLGKYRVLRELGAGGLGSVFEVEHALTHNRHALKVLHARHAMDANKVSRLVREAGVAGRVQNARLVQTLDVGQLDDGRTYLLMELLEGRSWRERLRTEGRLAPGEAARLGVQVCEGLAAAHAVGVVHRDLKPDNVFLVGPPGREEVKLVDFGIAKNLPGFTDQFGALTAAGGVLGTPHYLSPEQGAGSAQVDARTDQYALGVMLYESLTGVRPFEGPSIAAIIVAIQEARCAPLREVAPDVPPGLAATVERAMRRDVAKRFRDVNALAAALAPFAAAQARAAAPPVARVHGPEAWADTDAMPATAPSTPPARPAPRPRRAAWVAVGIALALLVGAGVGVGFWQLARGGAGRRAGRAPRPVRELFAPRDETTPDAPEAFASLAPRLRPVARLLPTELAGYTLARGPTQVEQEGHRGVGVLWRGAGDGEEVGLVVYDGYAGMAVLAALPAYRNEYGSIRDVTVQGRPGRGHFTHPNDATFYGATEVLLEGRWRVVGSSSGIDDPELSTRVVERLDLGALARL